MVGMYVCFVCLFVCFCLFVCKKYGYVYHECEMCMEYMCMSDCICYMCVITYMCISCTYLCSIYIYLQSVANCWCFEDKYTINCWIRKEGCARVLCTRIYHLNQLESTWRLTSRAMNPATSMTFMGRYHPTHFSMLHSTAPYKTASFVSKNYPSFGSNPLIFINKKNFSADSLWQSRRTVHLVQRGSLGPLVSSLGNCE